MFSRQPYYFRFTFWCVDNEGNERQIPVEANSLRQAEEVIEAIRAQLWEHGDDMRWYHCEMAVCSESAN